MIDDHLFKSNWRITQFKSRRAMTDKSICWIYAAYSNIIIAIINYVTAKVTKSNRVLRFVNDAKIFPFCDISIPDMLLSRYLRIWNVSFLQNLLYDWNSIRTTKSENSREDPYMTHYRHPRHSRILGVRMTRFVSAPSHDISCSIDDILKIGRTGPEANGPDKWTVLDGRPESQNRQIGVAGGRVREIGMDFVARNLPIHSSFLTPLVQFKSPQGHQ